MNINGTEEVAKEETVIRGAACLTKNISTLYALWLNSTRLSTYMFHGETH